VRIDFTSISAPMQKNL